MARSGGASALVRAEAGSNAAGRTASRSEARTVAADWAAGSRRWVAAGTAAVGASAFPVGRGGAGLKVSVRLYPLLTAVGASRSTRYACRGSWANWSTMADHTSRTHAPWPATYLRQADTKSAGRDRSRRSACLGPEGKHL